MSRALLLAVSVMAQTMSMQQAMEQAIAHSPEVRVLEASVAEARANATLADAFHSSASISATPGYATGLPTAVLGQVPAIGTVEAHRLLYDASARAEQIGAASQIDAAVARLEAGKREIGQRAAELYARVAADGAITSSALRRVAAYETIAARTQALRNEGRARDLDVTRAALQVANAKRTALQAQTRKDLDCLRLTRMLAADGWCGAAGLGGAPAPQAAEVGGDSLSVTQTNDPELRALETRIASLQRAAALEDRRFQPSIAAQIQYSRLFDRFRRYYLNFKPDDFSVAASITLPVWTGGRRAAASARTTAQLQQLIAQRDARGMEIELALRDAEADVALANAESELADRVHAAAVDGLRIAEQMAQEGRGEANDVLLAQVALADADDDVTNARAHVAVARARLLVIRGNTR